MVSSKHTQVSMWMVHMCVGGQHQGEPWCCALTQALVEGNCISLLFFWRQGNSILETRIGEVGDDCQMSHGYL